MGLKLLAWVAVFTPQAYVFDRLPLGSELEILVLGLAAATALFTASRLDRRRAA